MTSDWHSLAAGTSGTNHAPGRGQKRQGLFQMKIERKFTKAGQDAYAGVEFVTTSSEIRNPDGTIVFKLDDCEVPASWSQVASDVIAQKYFRKAGVPSALKKVREKDVPEFLWRSVADGDAEGSDEGNAEGPADGDAEESDEGDAVGVADGLEDGAALGA